MVLWKSFRMQKLGFCSGGVHVDPDLHQGVSRLQTWVRWGGHQCNRFRNAFHFRRLQDLIPRAQIYIDQSFVQPDAETTWNTKPHFENNRTSRAECLLPLPPPNPWKPGFHRICFVQMLFQQLMQAKLQIGFQQLSPAVFFFFTSNESGPSLAIPDTGGDGCFCSLFFPALSSWPLSAKSSVLCWWCILHLLGDVFCISCSL